MLKVIGAGFGRTGTYSLKAALEQIGFGPCFHMSEVFANRDRAEYFSRAARGEAVDWDAAFEGYRSTVDWPSSAFYAQLAEKYPEAKVILTLRDPEKWFASCMRTIAWRGEESHADQEPSDDPVDQMIDTVIWRGTFDRKFDQKERSIAIYDRHVREVEKRIAPERLLRFDVAEGWEPLCAFLGADVPSEPFPRLNDTESFRKNFLEQEEEAVTA